MSFLNTNKSKKNVALRLTISFVGAAIVTVFLFVIMMLLIAVKFTPENTEKLTKVEFIIQKKQLIRKVELSRPVPKLNEVSLPPRAKINRKPNRTRLPEIKEVVYQSKLSFDTTPQLNARSNKSNLASGLGQIGNATGSESGNGIGLTDRPNGISCTIGAIISENYEVVELSWYNCQSSKISDSSEAELYQWIKDHPLEVSKYANARDEEVFFTFDSKSSAYRN